MSLLVVGTMAFDTIETPFGKADRILGGAATYIGYSASHFTKDIHLVSVIGEDFPEAELNAMKKRGMKTNGVEKVSGQKSFFWHGRYHSDMNSRDTLATELNVLTNFTPKVPDSAKGCDFLMLGNLTPSVQMSVLEQMQVRPKLVAMDTMNFWMDTAMDDLKKVLLYVDVLTINDGEARQLSGEYSLVKAARKIFELGPKYLIVKKGEHGALLFHRDQVFFAPALPLEDVYDPTGAGDTFAGGFIGFVASQNRVTYDIMKSGVIMGSAMASFCVEKFGLERLREVKDDEVHHRVQDFIDLVQFEIELSD